MSSSVLMASRSPSGRQLLFVEAKPPSRISSVERHPQATLHRGSVVISSDIRTSPETSSPETSNPETSNLVNAVSMGRAAIVVAAVEVAEDAKKDLRAKTVTASPDPNAVQVSRLLRR
jgi:hypothetical protein